MCSNCDRLNPHLDKFIISKDILEQKKQSKIRADTGLHHLAIPFDIPASGSQAPPSDDFIRKCFDSMSSSEDEDYVVIHPRSSPKEHVPHPEELETSDPIVSSPKTEVVKITLDFKFRNERDPAFSNILNGEIEKFFNENPEKKCIKIGFGRGEAWNPLKGSLDIYKKASSIIPPDRRSYLSNNHIIIEINRENKNIIVTNVGTNEFSVGGMFTLQKK